MSTTGQRRRRSAQGARSGNPLHAPAFGRRLFAFMAVVAAIFLAVQAYRVVHHARNFGNAYLGMTRQEVQYRFGRPGSRSADDRLWRTRDGDAELSFLFGAGDRLVAVGCRGATPAGGDGCPAPLGVGVGGGEELVWDRLGPPTRLVFDGDRLLMDYPALGLRFALKKGAVVAIEHRHWRNALALLGQALVIISPA